MEKIHTVIADLITKFKLIVLPSSRKVYLVTDGLYKGEWLVRVSKTFDHTVFFSLPDKYERIIPDKDVAWGIANKVIIPVDVLPKKVHNVCLAEYELTKRTNSTNRREQRSAPRSLDRKKYKDSLNELAGRGNRELVHLYKNDKVKRDNVQDE